MNYYILSQVISFIGLVIGVCIPHMEKKTKILMWQLAANATGILSFALLDKMTTASSSLLGSVQLLALYREEQKEYSQRRRTVICLFFTGLYIINTAFTYQSWFDILPCVAISLHYVGVAQPDLAKFRWCLIGSCFLWCLYDISVLSFVMLATHAIGLVSAISSKLRLDRKKR